MNQKYQSYLQIHEQPISLPLRHIHPNLDRYQEPPAHDFDFE